MNIATSSFVGALARFQAAQLVQDLLEAGVQQIAICQNPAIPSVDVSTPLAKPTPAIGEANVADQVPA